MVFRLGWGVPAPGWGWGGARGDGGSQKALPSVSCPALLSSKPTQKSLWSLCCQWVGFSVLEVQDLLCPCQKDGMTCSVRLE